jgi:DDE superfamily endonuclease
MPFDDFDFWATCYLLLDNNDDDTRRRQPYRPPCEYPHRPHYRTAEFQPFSLDEWGPGMVKLLCRFTKEEIRRFTPYLQLDLCIWTDDCHPTPEEAIVVVLVRLSAPERAEHLAIHMRRSPSFISKVFNQTLQYLDRRYRSLIEWHPLITYERIEYWSKCLREAHGAEGIWGFIDGTFTGFCRASDNSEQRRDYSGYKKGHGMKWQAISTPDGLIVSLYGPYRGATGDALMVEKSQLEHKLRLVSLDFLDFPGI